MALQNLEVSQAYILLSFIIFTYSVHWLFRRHYGYWKEKNVPSLYPIVPVGDLLNVVIRKWTLGQAIGEHYLEFSRMGVKHGGIYALHRPVYIPVDPDIIKHILITDSDNFPNRGLYVNHIDDPLSAQIFNMEGNPWRDLRTKLPRVYTAAKMRQMFVMMVDLTDKLTTRLDVCKEGSNGINVKYEIAKFTADGIARCGFGVESNTMSGENVELLKHARLFFDYQFHIYKNAMVLNFPRSFLKKFNFKIFKKDSTKYVLDMFEKMKFYRKTTSEQRDDLASTLFGLTEKNENVLDYTGNKIMEPLSDNDCFAHMWAFLCASVEAPSGTITFALYELSKNQDCQQKLRDEINFVLSKHGNRITYEAVMDMKYLECVIDGKYS